jgi:Zinc-ribbon containing domain
MLAKKPENIYYAVIMQQMTHKSYNRLVDGYNRMMASIRTTFSDTRIKEMSLSWSLQIAAEDVISSSDITPNEAFEIGELIKRDINDAAEVLMENSVEFSDWLMLDIDVIERKTVELFLHVAELTRFELEHIYYPNSKPSLY